MCVHRATTIPPRTPGVRVLAPHLPSLPPPWKQALEPTDRSRKRRGSSAQGRWSEAQLCAWTTGGEAAVLRRGGGNHQNRRLRPPSRRCRNPSLDTVAGPPPQQWLRAACPVRTTQNTARLQRYDIHLSRNSTDAATHEKKEKVYGKALQNKKAEP